MLTEEQIYQARLWHKTGLKVSALAEHFGVSPSCIAFYVTPGRRSVRPKHNWKNDVNARRAWVEAAKHHMQREAAHDQQ